MAQTVTHQIYYPTLTDVPDVPEESRKQAVSVDSALSRVVAAKQDRPTNNTTMLTYATGQSGNPVTVWSTPQNTTNNPSGGQNIQLEWSDTKQVGWTGSFPNGYRLRVHIDARSGQSGQSFHDVSWAFSERRVSYGGFGYSQSTNKAVAVAGVNGQQGNDLHLLWLNGYYRAQVDTTFVGDFAYTTPSSIRFKDIDPSSDWRESAGAFVDSVDPVRFVYKRDADLVGLSNRGREHLGFIAEDVRDKARTFDLPKDMVEYDGHGEPSAISTQDLVALLWATVQDLRARVAELETEA